MPSSDQVRAAVDGYVATFDSGDRSAWLALFSPDASLTDPVPADAVIGHKAIGEFWDGMMGMADRLRLESRAVHICGEEAALIYTVTAASSAGSGVSFDGVEIFTVDDDGLIVSAVAYWDPAQIRPLTEGTASS